MKRYIIEKQVIQIGRGTDNDIVIDNASVSRKHAKIMQSHSGEYRLFDLESANGTTLNSMKFANPAGLSDQDVIGIGKFELVFSGEAIVEFAVRSTDTGLQEKTIIVAKAEKDARFVSAASTAPAPTRAPKLVLVEGLHDRKVVDLAKSEITVGKAKECDIQLSGLFAPKLLAKITRDLRGNYILEDVEGKGDILINNQKIQGKHKLVDKDVLNFRGISYVFR